MCQGVKSPGDGLVLPMGLLAGWGHSAPSGTFLCAWGQSARPVTGILSLGAQDVPIWSGVHPAAWNVPGRLGE